ncbi:hypothetical protein L195_g017087 [Trifolium pratense]|uniref:RNase H type-1 domain-containing protein n=1 Tax=Trifolium pratense TaxID=57577 RepID=A0A2K3MT74_TRIPR|nr:hypothetical protein L195_g017087 [Trifolium pratense]
MGNLNSPFGLTLVKNIRRLVDMEWEVHINHAYRESNQCVDALANIGFWDRLRPPQSLYPTIIDIAKPVNKMPQFGLLERCYRFHDMNHKYYRIGSPYEIDFQRILIKNLDKPFNGLESGLVCFFCINMSPRVESLSNCLSIWGILPGALF